MIPGKFWSRFPVLRYCLFFILGILFYQQVPGIPNAIFAIPLTLALLTIIRIFPIRHTAFFSGVLIMLIVFLMAYVLTEFRDPHNNGRHLLNRQSGSENGFTAIVTEGPRETAKTHRYLVKLTGIYSDTGEVPAEGRVILYLRKDSLSAQFRYGDLLMISGKPVRIKGAKNAWEFDYSAFMANKGVFHQVFAKSEAIILTDRGMGSPIKAFAIKVRDYCRKRLKEMIKNPEVLGVSEALLLGIRQDLDRQVKNAFVDAGAIHVLAVSGLHVGIIYQILIWSFGFLKKYPMGKILIYSLSIATLFAYALITGFSPSVTRAVLMFSIVATGNLISRKSNIYNTLALAAMIILITDTSLLFDVGFQLSFAAVFGIVYFYPLLTNGFAINNQVIDKLYKLSCVSIGAQIATLPFTLYYFHQFPNLFLLSNFVVIPLAGIILGSGIALIACAGIPFLSIGLGWLHSSLILLMNKGVLWINEIPNSVTRHIFFDKMYLALISILLITLVLVIEYRKRKYVYAMTMVLLMIPAYHWLLSYDRNNKQSVLVFNHMGKTAFALNDGINLNLVSGETDWAENYSLAGYLSFYPAGLKYGDMSDRRIETEHYEYLQWSGRGFFKPKNAGLKPQSMPDWLIIDAENADWRPDTVYNPIEGFILGRNIPFFRRMEIISALEERAFVFHDLKEMESIEIPCNGSDREN